MAECQTRSTSPGPGTGRARPPPTWYPKLALLPTRRTPVGPGTVRPPPIHRDVPNWQCVRHAVRLRGQALDAAPSPHLVSKIRSVSETPGASGPGHCALLPPSIVRFQIGSVSDAQDLFWGKALVPHHSPPHHTPKWQCFQRQDAFVGARYRLGPPPSSPS